MATKKRVTTRRRAKAEKLSPWNSAEYLRDERDIAAYFDAAIKEAGDDPAYMLHVLNTIARARGMMKLAADAGLTRGGVYKALAQTAKPSFQTVHKIAKALGLQLTLKRAA